MSFIQVLLLQISSPTSIWVKSKIPFAVSKINRHFYMGHTVVCTTQIQNFRFRTHAMFHRKSPGLIFQNHGDDFRRNDMNTKSEVLYLSGTNYRTSRVKIPIDFARSKGYFTLDTNGSGK